MIRLLLVIVATLGTIVLRAQLLTWTPPFPEEAAPSQTLTITVDATKGNKGLFNYTNTGDAFTFVSPEEEPELKAIERAVGRRLPRIIARLQPAERDVIDGAPDRDRVRARPG